MQEDCIIFIELFYQLISVIITGEYHGIRQCVGRSGCKMVRAHVQSSEILDTRHAHSRLLTSFINCGEERSWFSMLPFSKVLPDSCFDYAAKFIFVVVI